MYASLGKAAVVAQHASWAGHSNEQSEGSTARLRLRGAVDDSCVCQGQGELTGGPRLSPYPSEGGPRLLWSYVGQQKTRSCHAGDLDHSKEGPPSSLSSVGAGLGVVWWVTYCVSAQLEPTPCCPYQIAKARVVRGDTGLGRWASGEGSVCQVPCTPAAKLTPRPRGCSPVPGRFRPMRTRMTCLEGKHAEGRGRTCRVVTARRSCS